jgi:hypothetical protein
VPGQQRGFLRGFDVAGQQQARGLPTGHTLHAEHAAQRIRLERQRVVCRQGVQHLEAHAIPLPGLARFATLMRRGTGQQRVAIGQRSRQLLHRQAGLQRGCPAHMVHVAMAQHQEIHLTLAARAQQRQEHAHAGIRFG